MKTLILALLIALLASTVCAQTVMVEYRWAQPDSTMGSLTETGAVVGKMKIPDGWLSHYFIEVKAGSNTTTIGPVEAPASISAEGVAVVPVSFNTPTTVRVKAVDKEGRESAYGAWSLTFTVDPGPPVPPGQPFVARVYLGG